MAPQQDPSSAARLRELIHRKDRVLAVLHTPSAALARIMELGGCEAGFVGTSGVVGAYTGLADVLQARCSAACSRLGTVEDIQVLTHLSCLRFGKPHFNWPTAGLPHLHPPGAAPDREQSECGADPIT